MSMNKTAQEAYYEGFLDTLRNLNVSDAVKVAAYKQAATAEILAGGIGQYQASRDMQDAGFTNREIDEVSTLGGGALRGIGKGLAYSAGGALAGGLLGAGIGHLTGDETYRGLQGAAIGSTLGNLYGIYRGYQGERERGQEAIKERQLLEAIAKGKKKKTKKKKK